MMTPLLVLGIGVLFPRQCSGDNISALFEISDGIKPCLGPYGSSVVRSRIECLVLCAKDHGCKAVMLSGSEPYIDCHVQDLYSLGCTTSSPGAELCYKAPAQRPKPIPVSPTDPCVASSERWTTCHNAVDGKLAQGTDWISYGEHSGLWIKLVFASEAFVFWTRYWFRCYIADQYSRVTFETSYGAVEEVTRPCVGTNHYSNCTGMTYERFNLPFDQPTTFINITGYDDCQPGELDNGGIREVEFWGMLVT